MSEREPSIVLRFSEGIEFEASAENTAVYSFMGRTAIGSMVIENSSLDHIYLKVSDDPASPKGKYIFKQFNQEVHSQILEFAQQNNFPQLLNLRDLPESDVRAYFIHQEAEAARFGAQIPDSIPEDFE